MQNFIDLIGSPSGPGWGSTAAVAVYLIKLHVRYGQVHGLLLAISKCPKSGCPYAAPAASLASPPNFINSSK